MNQELYQIEKNDTWELVPRPKDKNVLGVEPDYHPDLEVIVLAGCISREDCTPLHTEGTCPPHGGSWGPIPPPRLGAPGEAPPKLKIYVKFPCKIL